MGYGLLRLGPKPVDEIKDTGSSPQVGQSGSTRRARYEVYIPKSRIRCNSCNPLRSSMENFTEPLTDTESTVTWHTLSVNVELKAKAATEFDIVSCATRSQSDKDRNIAPMITPIMDSQDLEYFKKAYLSGLENLTPDEMWDNLVSEVASTLHNGATDVLKSKGNARTLRNKHRQLLSEYQMEVRDDGRRGKRIFTFTLGTWSIDSSWLRSRAAGRSQTQD